MRRTPAVMFYTATLGPFNSNAGGIDYYAVAQSSAQNLCAPVEAPERFYAVNILG